MILSSISCVKWITTCLEEIKSQEEIISKKRKCFVLSHPFIITNDADQSDILSRIEDHFDWSDNMQKYKMDIICKKYGHFICSDKNNKLYMIKPSKTQDADLYVPYTMLRKIPDDTGPKMYYSGFSVIYDRVSLVSNKIQNIMCYIYIYDYIYDGIDIMHIDSHQNTEKDTWYYHREMIIWYLKDKSFIDFDCKPSNIIMSPDGFRYVDCELVASFENGEIKKSYDYCQLFSSSYEIFITLTTLALFPDLFHDNGIRKFNMVKLVGSMLLSVGRRHYIIEDEIDEILERYPKLKSGIFSLLGIEADMNLSGIGVLLISAIFNYFPILFHNNPDILNGHLEFTEMDREEMHKNVLNYQALVLNILCDISMSKQSAALEDSIASCIDHLKENSTSGKNHITSVQIRFMSIMRLRFGAFIKKVPILSITPSERDGILKNQKNYIVGTKNMIIAILTKTLYINMYKKRFNGIPNFGNEYQKCILAKSDTNYIIMSVPKYNILPEMKDEIEEIISRWMHVTDYSVEKKYYVDTDMQHRKKDIIEHYVRTFNEMNPN